MAGSSDDELEDLPSVKIVGGNYARVTLEVVMPAGTPGQLVRFKTKLGTVEITVPFGMVPGRKFRVDVVPGRGAAAWCSADPPPPARSTDGPERSHHGSSMGGSSDDGLEDEDGHSSRSKQDNCSAKIVALEDANVTIELVVPVGMQPGERISFETPVGMPAGHPLAGKKLSVKTPPNLGPGRTYLVHWTPPAPARSTDGSGGAQEAAEEATEDSAEESAEDSEEYSPEETAEEAADAAKYAALSRTSHEYARVMGAETAAEKAVLRDCVLRYFKQCSQHCLPPVFAAEVLRYCTAQGVLADAHTVQHVLDELVLEMQLCRNQIGLYAALSLAESGCSQSADDTAAPHAEAQQTQQQLAAARRPPAWEGNCPKAEDSDGVAQWALTMLRAKSPEEAATSEYSLRLYTIIGKDVSLVSLITRMLKVRRCRATFHVSIPKSNAAPHECGAQEVCAWPQYKPSVNMLLSVMATEPRCRFETWHRSLMATRPPGGVTSLRSPARALKTPRDCSGLASTRPLTTSRRENDIALGKLVGADAYVEYVMANGR